MNLPSKANRGAVADPAVGEDSRPVRTPDGGVCHIPWVTLRSPTAKSRRLAPPGSRPVRTYLHPRFLRKIIPEGGCNAPLHLGFALHSTVIGITLAEGANMRR